MILPNTKEFIVEASSEKNITCHVSDLDVSTQYEITVTPLIVDNIGYCESVVVMNSTFLSSPPSSFKAKLFEKGQIKVKWEKPERLTEEEIQNYWLEYKKEGEDWRRETLESNVFEYVFSKFHYSTTYKLRILASFRKKKQSRWSREEPCITGKLNVPVIAEVFNFNSLFQHCLSYVKLFLRKSDKTYFSLCEICRNTEFFLVFIFPNLD